MSMDLARRARYVPAPTDSTRNPAATGETLSTSASKNAPLTDPNIVALLDEANKADSAAGAFAIGMATSPGVKAFAKMMMGDHHALRVQGEALAKKLNVSSTSLARHTTTPRPTSLRS